MNKLVITSVKINSVNNQTLPLKEFSDGFNIVCGLNEAGKSTMMEFLKEALFAPRDYVGDIELTKSGTAYQVKIDGTKRNKAAKLKLLAPEDKERWAPSLYNIYLKLNMGRKFEEMSDILRKMRK